MGLRCSLLGHTFDEQDVTRQRDDRGNEVLTVVREIERCSRCGAERVVSESTEVTSVVGAEEAGIDEEPARDAARDAEVSPGGRGGGSDAGGFTDETFDPPGDPAEEDAEILEDEERAPGEWPGEHEADEPAAADDEPGGAGQSGVGSEGGGEIIDADAAGEGPADELAGEADVADTADETEEYEEESTFEPVGSSVTVPEGHYECPECGFTVDADSSFRDGDVCPECREGYLDHRE